MDQAEAPAVTVVAGLDNRSGGSVLPVDSDGPRSIEHGAREQTAGKPARPDAPARAVVDSGSGVCGSGAGDGDPVAVVVGGVATVDDDTVTVVAEFEGQAAGMGAGGQTGRRRRSGVGNQGDAAMDDALVAAMARLGEGS